jgi:hypothetical protein
MTTLDHPMDHIDPDDSTQPKITADPAVNLNRTARECLNHYFDQAQEHVLNMRETIKAKDAHIATMSATHQEAIDNLENEVLIQKSYASEYHADCAVLEAKMTLITAKLQQAMTDLDAAKACVLRAGLHMGELEQENERLRAITEAPNHSSTLDEVAARMWPKIDAAKRAKNVTRLASAALKHVRRGNTIAAEALISPLAQGVHDAYKHDGDTEDQLGLGPEPDRESVSSTGQHGPATDEALGFHRPQDHFPFGWDCVEEGEGE